MPARNTIGIRVREFDQYRKGYAAATVHIYVANSTDLAPLYLDPLRTRATVNPVRLTTYTDGDGVTFGKFATPIYTNHPYYVTATDTEFTATSGIEQPPLVSLVGEDLSLATAAAARGGRFTTLQDWLDREVWAGSFGTLLESDGSEACTLTLQAAIGAAAGQGGGYVNLPAGNIPFTRLTLSEGVVLRGKGKGTTTLRSFETQSVITLSGDGAGLIDLTLDGISVIAGSIGVAGVNVDASIMDNVLVQRFETGIRFKGAASGLWRNLSVSGCHTGAELRGDADLGQSAAGSSVANMRWEGGVVSLCTVAGVSLNFYDQPVREITLIDVGFVSNTGIAAKINGARDLSFEDCYWSSNLSNLSITDDTNTSLVAENTVENVSFRGGSFTAGTLTFNGACAGIQFVRTAMTNVSYNLTIPQSPITLIDCIEDSATTATGDTTKLQRSASDDRGTYAGVTTDATPITAWSRLLPAGGVVLVAAKIIGRRRNGPEYGIFHIEAGAARPGATLAVSLVTMPFTPGKVVIGQTSGASARITATSVTTGSGTVTLRDIRGTFISGEVLLDAANGTGRVNGQLVFPDAGLDGGGVTTIRAAQVTGAAGYAVGMDVSGGQVRVRLTGAANHIIEWTVEITIMEP